MPPAKLKEHDEEEGRTQLDQPMAAADDDDGDGLVSLEQFAEQGGGSELSDTSDDDGEGGGGGAALERSLAIDMSGGVLWSGVALWDNDPTAESTADDLHFSKGDIIHALADDIDEVGPDWAVGQIHGTADADHHGFFPVAFVRRLAAEELQRLQRAPAAAPEPGPEPGPGAAPLSTEAAHARTEIEEERQKAAQAVAGAQEADAARARAESQLAEAREAMERAEGEAQEARAAAQQDRRKAEEARASSLSEREHARDAGFMLAQQCFLLAQAQAQELVALAMETAELSAMGEEEPSDARIDTVPSAAADRSAVDKAEQEVAEAWKVAEEQAARFAQQAARMSEAAEARGLEDVAGVPADDYGAVLEQLAEEQTRREGAEKAAAEAKIELQAAQRAAAGTAAASSVGANLEDLKVQLERERAARMNAEAEAARARESAHRQSTSCGTADQKPTAAEQVANDELQRALENAAAERKARAAAERQTQEVQAQLRAAQELARRAGSAAEAGELASAEAVAATHGAAEKSAELEQAATTIQRCYRGNAARMDLEEQGLAATQIQCGYRGSAARRDLAKKRQKFQTDLEEAARQTEAAAAAAATMHAHAQREEESECPSVEEQELEAFTQALTERGSGSECRPMPAPDADPPLAELLTTDAEQNAAWLSRATDELRHLSEVMSEILAENPELSLEQVQEALAHAKGTRKIVGEAEYRAYSRAKLSATNLDDEMARAQRADRVQPSQTGRPANVARPTAVRGRAHRGGTPVTSTGETATADASNCQLPASTRRRVAKMIDAQAENTPVGGSTMPTQQRKIAAFTMMGSPRGGTFENSTQEPRPPLSKRRGATPAPKSGRRTGKRKQKLQPGRDDVSSARSNRRSDLEDADVNQTASTTALKPASKARRPKPPKRPASASAEPGSGALGSGNTIRHTCSTRHSDTRIGAAPIRPAASGRIPKPPYQDTRGSGARDDITLIDDARRLMDEVARLAGARPEYSRGDAGEVESVPHAAGEPSAQAVDVLGALPPAMIDGLAEVMRTDNRDLRRRAAAVAGVLLEGDIGALQQALVDAGEAKKLAGPATLVARQGGQKSETGLVTEEEALRAEWDRAAVAEHVAERGSGSSGGAGYVRPNSASAAFRCASAGASSAAGEGRSATSNTSSKNGRWSLGRRTPPHLRKDKDDNPGLTRPAYPDKLSRLSSGVAAPCFTDLTPLARERRQNAAMVQALRASGGDVKRVLKVVRKHNRTQRNTDKRLSQPNVDHSGGVASARHESSRAHTEILPVFVRTKESSKPQKRPQSAPKERGGGHEEDSSADATRTGDGGATGTSRRPMQPRPVTAQADGNADKIPIRRRPLSASPRSRRARQSPEVSGAVNPSKKNDDTAEVFRSRSPRRNPVSKTTCCGTGTVDARAMDSKPKQKRQPRAHRDPQVQHPVRQQAQKQGQQHDTTVEVTSESVVPAQPGIAADTFPTAPPPLWQQQQGSSWDYQQTSKQYGVAFEGKRVAHPSGRQSIADAPTVGTTVVMLTRASSSSTATAAQEYGRQSAGGTRRKLPCRGVRGAGRSVAVGVASIVKAHRRNSTPRVSDSRIQEMQVRTLLGAFCSHSIYVVPFRRSSLCLT